MILNMKFFENDVAIVEYSGIFADSENEVDLFDRLLQGKCLIGELKDFGHHFSDDRKAQDRCYSNLGSKVPVESILKWADKNGLTTQSATAVEIVMHELMRRMVERTPGLFKGKKCEAIIGLSTGETDPYRIGQRKLFEELSQSIQFTDSEKERIQSYLSSFDQFPKRKDWLAKDVFSTLIFESVRTRFGISGACAFVDAACASSLAALMLAVRRIETGEADLVISGGVDISVVLVTLLAFSKLQVLSDKVMVPFDQKADGMNQGEAGALFALTTLANAKKENLRIYGVIRNCDGSSDGALGGMVEPTEYGQQLAYERAYSEVPLYPLSYLECHGTGTKLGDKTELSSTAKFFHPLPPIGSVKANVGHTIAAAGAVSMVKALKTIEHRTVPQMPNFRRMEKKWPHTINKENLSLNSEETIRVGVSSFGFGGANFHLVLDEYRNEELDKPNTNKDFKFLLNGSAEIDLAYVNELFSASRFKIPPVSLPYADPAVLGAMLAVDKLFSGLGAKLSQKMREKIGVVSNTNAYLERLYNCFERAGYLEFYRRMDDPERSARFEERAMPNQLPFTEDTFMWALNNLVAGRVTKEFDLKGPNFNLACEKASLGFTLDAVKSVLEITSGAYIVLSYEENLAKSSYRMERSKVTAYMVSDLQFSLAAALPIAFEIKQIKQKRIESAYVN